MPKKLNSQAKKAILGRETGDLLTLAWLEVIGYLDALSALQENNAKEKKRNDIVMESIKKASGDNYSPIKTIAGLHTEFIEDSVSLGADKVRKESDSV